MQKLYTGSIDNHRYISEAGPQPTVVGPVERFAAFGQRWPTDAGPGERIGCLATEDAAHEDLAKTRLFHLVSKAFEGAPGERFSRASRVPKGSESERLRRRLRKLPKNGVLVLDMWKKCLHPGVSVLEQRK